MPFLSPFFYICFWRNIRKRERIPVRYNNVYCISANRGSKWTEKCTNAASLEKFAVTKEPLSICADPQIDLMMLIVCGVIQVIGTK